MGRPRLAVLRSLVERNDDFATFTPAEVAEVAVTVSLMTAAASVMSAPLCDENGLVTDASARLVADAHDWAAAAEQRAA